MDKRGGKGSQKIELKLIESKEARTVAFSKRKHGLDKKPKEYSNLTGADIDSILFTQAGKSHSYGSPSVEKVIDKFHELKQNNSQQNHTDMSKTNVFEAFEDLRKEVQAFKKKDLGSELPTDKYMLENRLKQFEAYKSRLDKIKNQIKGDVPAEQFNFISEVALKLEKMSS
ncbi:putative CAAX prenyl protease 1 -like protein [Capsicum annuum]|uniref:MADS-box domain-containing protein n=1 Tax=Capsicum annuum TaxID=4072 RepID=A0A1U8GA40_CAPAN|nr:agamous-like MADS-box protein AGL29 [Capsicum annuum]KAF3666930.1 putative CAAX prenyl protease 1 -like protein [Capsicum annuum]KAF3673714.1 putative CAAX prenyl protease 1 -like protein [Capsicum annuum]PHT92735.1 hypothetical protein T459_00617 [Capsicum annuum]